MSNKVKLTPMEFAVLRAAHMKTVEAIASLDTELAADAVQDLVESVEAIIESRYMTWESDGRD